MLNGNRIIVAYMTSGNIAVFDHDVLRYVEVLERLATDAHLGRRQVDTLAERGARFLRVEGAGRSGLP